MRYNDERAVASDIKNKRFMPAYLLTGDEAYLKTAYRGKIIDAALGSEKSGFNLITFSGKADLSEVESAVITLPLLAGRRCVVIDEFVPEKVTESEIKKWRDIFMSIAGETLLLLVQSAPPDADKKKAAESFYAVMDEFGCAVVTLSGRKGKDLIHFVMRRCEDSGSAIESETAKYLIETTGEDMARLGSECDKLSAYAGKGGTVTPAMIDMLTPAAVEADVYKLSRHIISGDLDSALRLLGSLLYLKTPPGLIMSTLCSSFADLCRAREGFNKGYSQEKIAKDFGYRLAFRVKNALRDAKPLSREGIEAAMSALLEADYDMKTTQQDERILFERAIVRAAAALRGEIF